MKIARMMRARALSSLIAILPMFAACNVGVCAEEAATTGGRSAALPYYNRANRYLKEGRYDDALRDLQEAIKLFPDEPDFHTNLGIAYRKLDRYVDAEKEFKIAIAYDRNDWMNWSNLANAYLKQDKLEKTVETFEETLKHKPPADEQAAIRKDIADIQKILTMRQGSSEKPPASQKTASGSTTKGSPAKPGTNAKARSGQKPPAATQSPTTIQKTTLNQSDESPSASARVNPTAATSAESSVPHTKAVEKKADWGYDAK